MSGHNGVRQYGMATARISADHVKRYQFAASMIGCGTVLDAACGCGYGTKILHDSGCKVIGIDISGGAIEFARKHYPGPAYICGRVDAGFIGEFDAVVSLETLEHLADPLSLLGAARGRMLIASVPNEVLYPFSAEHFADDEYPHQRHYTPEQFDSLLSEAGYTVMERWCQRDKKLCNMVPGVEGKFLIYVCHG